MLIFNGVCILSFHEIFLILDTKEVEKQITRPKIQSLRNSTNSSSSAQPEDENIEVAKRSNATDNVSNQENERAERAVGYR